MTNYFTIYWSDGLGYTGSTQVIANCVKDVKQYFEANFARAGYILHSIA